MRPGEKAQPSKTIRQHDQHAVEYLEQSGVDREAHGEQQDAGVGSIPRIEKDADDQLQSTASAKLQGSPRQPCTGRSSPTSTDRAPMPQATNVSQRAPSVCCMIPARICSRVISRNRIASLCVRMTLIPKTARKTAEYNGRLARTDQRIGKYRTSTVANAFMYIGRKIFVEDEGFPQISPNAPRWSAGRRGRFATSRAKGSREPIELSCRRSDLWTRIIGPMRSGYSACNASFISGAG